MKFSHSVNGELIISVFCGNNKLLKEAPPRSSPYFLQLLVFCNDFEELQTMVFEVELIINNAPLNYVFTQILSKHV